MVGIEKTFQSQSVVRTKSNLSRSENLGSFLSMKVHIIDMLLTKYVYKYINVRNDMACVLILVSMLLRSDDEGGCTHIGCSGSNGFILVVNRNRLFLFEFKIISHRLRFKVKHWLTRSGKK